MSSLAPTFISASSAVILLLGLMHLFFTFHGPKFVPRDPALHARMQEISPVISRQTTMWKAWVGFNASHSLGAILFGAVYGYLSVLHAGFLFQSTFLLVLGLLLLLCYLALSKRYWFSIPFRGILLATVLYALALVFRMS